MTWFGFIVLFFAVVGMLTAFTGNESEERAALIFIVNALWFAGVLFVGTGHI